MHLQTNEMSSPKVQEKEIPYLSEGNIEEVEYLMIVNT